MHTYVNAALPLRPEPPCMRLRALNAPCMRMCARACQILHAASTPIPANTIVCMHVLTKMFALCYIYSNHQLTITN